MCHILFIIFILASFTHIDVHSARGGENSASSLEGAAKDKRKEYHAAYSSFLKIVKELREAGAPRADGAATLCEIARNTRLLRHP